jgi:uncharacterized membrane protein (UPF0127 family)
VKPILWALLAVGAPAAAADCPNHDLPRTVVTVTTTSGDHRFHSEIADTPAAQECGLMFRKKMPRDAGMWFPVLPPRPASFWMKNTILSLDIVFVAPNGRVLTIASRAKPYSLDLIDSGGTIAGVLELNAGEAGRIGMKPGDKVTLGAADR